MKNSKSVRCAYANYRTSLGEELTAGRPDMASIEVKNRREEYERNNKTWIDWDEKSELI